jgi:hypothetical protein
VTDKGLAELKNMKTLEMIFLLGTNVSANGVMELKKALPKCIIDK